LILRLTAGEPGRRADHDSQIEEQGLSLYVNRDERNPQRKAGNGVVA